MSGVIVNGFGWREKYYPKRGLGRHYCMHCRSVQDFILHEVEKKLVALFISTITIGKKKYAVLCANCGEGYDLEDYQAHSLLYQDSEIEIGFEGLKIIDRDEKSLSASESKYICPKCGRPCLESGNFCVYCGQKLR